MGRKNLPGRPLVYGTTKKFLEVFDLKDLESLPKLKEIEALGIEEEPEKAGGEKAERKRRRDHPGKRNPSARNLDRHNELIRSCPWPASLPEEKRMS